MDNLSVHKNTETLSPIESVGAKAAFLPPLPPDLNPIEMMWSKVKSILRRIEPRDADSLFEAVTEALSQVIARDTIGWFNHCGYNFI